MLSSHGILKWVIELEHRQDHAFSGSSGYRWKTPVWNDNHFCHIRHKVWYGRECFIVCYLEVEYPNWILLTLNACCVYEKHEWGLRTIQNVDANLTKIVYDHTEWPLTEQPSNDKQLLCQQNESRTDDSKMHSQYDSDWYQSLIERHSYKLK